MIDKEERRKYLEKLRTNLFLEEGSCVMIDEEFITDLDPELFKDYLGKVGVITKVKNECHAFGIGEIYSYKLKFGEEESDYAFPSEVLNDLGGVCLDYFKSKLPNVTKEGLLKLGIKIYEYEK